MSKPCPPPLSLSPCSAAFSGAIFDGGLCHHGAVVAGKDLHVRREDKQQKVHNNNNNRQIDRQTDTHSALSHGHLSGALSFGRKTWSNASRDFTTLRLCCMCSTVCAQSSTTIYDGGLTYSSQGVTIHTGCFDFMTIIVMELKGNATLSHYR